MGDWMDEQLGSSKWHLEVVEGIETAGQGVTAQPYPSPAPLLSGRNSNVS